MQRHRSGGFTLIEVLVAVVIVAILAAVAIPNYSQYVIRSKRAAAATVVVEAAGALERNFTTNGCYNKTTVNVCQTQAAGNDFSLGGLTAAPREGRASYAVAVGGFGANGQTFLLTATPCAAAGGACPAGNDNFSDPECGILRLSQAGDRSVDVGGTVSTNATNAALVARCWQR